jgi:hypothetical protein
MRRLAFALLLALLPLTVAAQTQVPSPVPPNTLIAFDHDGKITDAYILVVDGTETNLGKLTPVSGTTYETPFPAITPGTHTLAICAQNVAGRACSPPFPVAVVVVPSAPATLRIVTR